MKNKKTKPFVRKWDKQDPFDEMVHELLKDTEEKHAFIKTLKANNDSPSFIKDLLIYFDAYN